MVFPVASIVKSIGSINHSPAIPFVLFAEIFASNTSVIRPDVSTKPPAPFFKPALASIFPFTIVSDCGFATSLQRITLPPSPVAIPFASIFAPLSIETITAGGSLPLPRISPPMRISPPPVFPFAAI